MGTLHRVNFSRPKEPFFATERNKPTLYRSVDNDLSEKPSRTNTSSVVPDLNQRRISTAENVPAPKISCSPPWKFRFEFLLITIWLKFSNNLKSLEAVKCTVKNLKKKYVGESTNRPPYAEKIEQKLEGVKANINKEINRINGRANALPRALGPTYGGW